MVCINVILTVTDETDIPEIHNLLAELGRLSRQEPGCLRFEVYHSQNEPAVFILCERWESNLALDNHRQAEAFTTIYKPRVLPRVQRVPHVSTIIE